ncbi:MAG: hypothetical protein PHW76_04040 [Alphaproteobacteria bacterium]|nr:hypothetical protein [Alphaproteobacteria bacterium]
MPKIALISGADKNYFPLLIEWIDSVRRFKESEGMDICVIDSGMTSEQLATVKPFCKSIVCPEWPADLPERKLKGNEGLKTNVCRPFIREIFPGYDTYMWMDADTWVQEWSSVQMFLDAADKKKDRFVATNGADRNAPKLFRIKWLWRWPRRVTNFYFNNTAKPFGFAAAQKLCAQAVINAGCFALSAQAPHWDRWKKLIVKAANKGKLFTSDQISLGVMIYIDGYKAEMLPSYAHWSCNLAPLWDPQKKAFVEPSTPHMALGVLHMHGIDEERASKKNKRLYETTDGGQIELNIRNPHIDGGDMLTVRMKRK